MGLVELQQGVHHRCQRPSIYCEHFDATPLTNHLLHCFLAGRPSCCDISVCQEQEQVALMQAPPTLDEDNFPSLAGSPAPSVNGSTAASRASPAANGHATAVAASPESSPAQSPRQSGPAESASTPRAAAPISPALPSAWDSASTGVTAD